MKIEVIYRGVTPKTNRIVYEVYADDLRIGFVKSAKDTTQWQAFGYNLQHLGRFPNRFDATTCVLLRYKSWLASKTCRIPERFKGGLFKRQAA
jgi:hypothetical protein